MEQSRGETTATGHSVDDEQCCSRPHCTFATALTAPFRYFTPFFFFFCFYSSSSILRSGNPSWIYLGVFMLIISILIPLWLEILHNSININFYFFLNPIWILVFNFSNLFMCCMKLYNFTSYTTIV